MCMFKNECGQSSGKTLKLTVSEERTDGIKWFFACWYNFTQAKKRLKIFEIRIFKNGFGQSGDGTLKLTVSEEWTDGINLFLHVNTGSQKLKTDQNFLGWAWSKMGVASLVMGLENWLYLKNELME